MLVKVTKTADGYEKEMLEQVILFQCWAACSDEVVSSIYDRVITWSRHRHAPRYLAALSFSESSFFPIPPDVMLAPMVLANPHKAWNLALLTTVTSVLGGVLGYLIGTFSFELVEPLLRDAGYYPKYLKAKQWFDEWGILGGILSWFFPYSV